MEHDRVDVSVEGTEEQIVALESELGEDTILKMAVAARRLDVMISLTVSPYVADEPRDTAG